MIKVYIASPYTIGDQARNVYISLAVADELIKLGFYPYCPLLTHFQHMMFPQSYDKWLELDFEWLRQCDCLLRLDGESKGADLEVQEAGYNDIPVFYNIESLLAYYGREESTL
jgi:hypothetical protein